MDNQRLKGLTSGWRNRAKKLINNKSRPELSNSEAWLIAGTLDQCAEELEALVSIDETFDKKE